MQSPVAELNLRAPLASFLCEIINLQDAQSSQES